MVGPGRGNGSRSSGPAPRSTARCVNCRVALTSGEAPRLGTRQVRRRRSGGADRRAATCCSSIRASTRPLSAGGCCRSITQQPPLARSADRPVEMVASRRVDGAGLPPSSRRSRAICEVAWASVAAVGQVDVQRHLVDDRRLTEVPLGAVGRQVLDRRSPGACATAFDVVLLVHLDHQRVVAGRQRRPGPTRIPLSTDAVRRGRAGHRVEIVERRVRRRIGCCRLPLKLVRSLRGG